MTGEYEMDLHRAVAAFKTYQRESFPEITEDNDNGEWVFGGEFDHMRAACLGVLENVPCAQAGDAVIDDMLYAIARDNECSSLMPDTLRRPEWFARLCQASLGTNYTNAKWQFAEHLHAYDGERSVRELIFRFLETGDEYTERLALQSLAELYPERVEAYAAEFWSRRKYGADEYQKIMVLHVLNRVKSPLLERYLLEAEEMGYEYLRHYAREIRDGNSL